MKTYEVKLKTSPFSYKIKANSELEAIVKFNVYTENYGQVKLYDVEEVNN